MAQYVDGFLIPIQRKNLKAYKKMAAWGCKVWMKHGALSYYECFIDDFSKHGLGFKKMARIKKGETAIFAFIIFKSKSHRDSVNKKVFKEMHESGADVGMPFDMKRFATAGCQVILHSTIKKNKRKS